MFLQQFANVFSIIYFTYVEWFYYVLNVLCVKEAFLTSCNPNLPLGTFDR